SVAAAQVSAVAALRISRDRKLHGADVQQLLARTSRERVTAAGDYPLVNACAALVALQGQGSCLSEDSSVLPLAPDHSQEAARSAN
ncbi:MAG TPA: hypothetical protein VF902_09390, partial [Coriobacteriia bacterium]